MRPEDYVKLQGETCSLRIKSIDAGFNVLGMPAYIGYYIQHNWAENKMYFAPHSDSKNEALKKATIPKQELKELPIKCE